MYLNVIYEIFVKLVFEHTHYSHIHLVLRYSFFNPDLPKQPIATIYTQKKITISIITIIMCNQRQPFKKKLTISLKYDLRFSDPFLLQIYIIRRTIVPSIKFARFVVFEIEKRRVSV